MSREEEVPESRTPDREDAERVWDRVRRIESIEEMEKFLVESAEKQLVEGNRNETEHERFRRWLDKR
tara:strand:+ start:1261 stop:1461 length:201 start_codon:yes stop_codon:yes gene_type:complete